MTAQTAQTTQAGQNKQTEQAAPTGQHSWRPTRRRLTDGLLAALAPVAACCVALGALTTWTSTGNAGSPARIAVTSGRVFLPYGDTRDTAAFFRITNSWGANDRLLKVTSPAITGEAVLSRHRMTGGASAYGQTVESAAVPAGDTLDMSPTGLDVTVRAKDRWREFDLVPFTLHFERSGPIKTSVVVIRPGAEWR
ncbi:copper chaperone PCu(A)C [Streptomyces sp. WAC00469]|uniref:copper chaperone PCu(A)C n=1 Tax=Streptomyces sp. WAC00469 TaxID=2487415 RepID=UPI000F74703E|nr:copper chaperone PCu(A)C [Streptomyces sp. WAC00469]RSR96318.1 copper chaperone PCu(A)C [Streptomyces sp. WAC00469]